MNKFLSMFIVSGVLAFMAPSAFAWQYEGLNSLNPFTGFRVCNKCEKVKKDKCSKIKECPCKVQKVTKCPCQIR